MSFECGNWVELGRRERGGEVGGGRGSKAMDIGSQLLLTIHGQHSITTDSDNNLRYMYVYALLPAKQTTTILPTEFPIQT
jgi:hypothetical protein